MKRLKLVEDFELAVRERAFKGAQMPEVREWIELNYREAKQKLEAALRRRRKAYEKDHHLRH